MRTTSTAQKLGKLARIDLITPLWRFSEVHAQKARTVFLAGLSRP